MTYGIPYMGSKSDIAEWVVAHLPPGEVLVDVFAGGCAVTHAALLSRKWKRIIANDISDAPQLFLDAIHGRYRDERRWISRDEFLLQRHSDPYIRYCWSFGNRGDTYMYSRELEPYKRDLHRLLYAETPHARALAYRACVRHLARLLPSRGVSDSTAGLQSLDRLQNLESLQRLQRLQSLQSLQSLQRLQRLENLQSLERLESLQRLEVRRGDYRALDIPANAVIYCDPPYHGTASYNDGMEFDDAAFYAWCRAQTSPLVVSEYNMPDDFRLLAERRKNVNLAAKGTKYATERLYALNYAPLRQSALEFAP